MGIRFQAPKTLRKIAKPRKPKPLVTSPTTTYIKIVLRDYGYKRARNKRIGPGGGTRRLHQHPSFGDLGVEIGSTNV